MRRGAAAVLRALPARPAAALRIRVLGPLAVRRDGEPVDGPEVSRTRVRELLSLLVVERTVSRDRVVDLLWPELAPERGRANLRVTLRHLQRLVEPDRSQGTAPYFLRGDAQQLHLVAVPGLEVDVWEVEDLLAEAEAARRRGDQAGRIGHLRTAADLWRGRRPLPDLERLADLDHVARHLNARLVEAALTLGELELVGGSVDAAATLADQVLACDPYAERAHRLAVAAYMQGRDRSATQAAVDRLGRMLDDLGAQAGSHHADPAPQRHPVAPPRGARGSLTAPSRLRRSFVPLSDTIERRTRSAAVGSALDRAADADVAEEQALEHQEDGER